MVAELDYAYLAEYAKTDHGTITAIGASFTQVRVESVPSLLEIAVAGRMRRGIKDPAPQIRIEFIDPHESVLLSVEDTLESAVDSVNYAGKTAMVFAYRGPLPIDHGGLYRCKIYFDGELKRLLAFSVEE